MNDKTQTRERYIEAATQAFAERGFYGTSIAAIAQALPFTKQALLHHFGTKERLYGEVLKRISDRLMADLGAARARFPDPRERVEETFVALYRASLAHPDTTQLLMRELLDNKRRAETSRTWYLKPFLETLVGMLTSLETRRFGDRDSAFAVVYQLLGAINYFVVSEPTLVRMLGEEAYGRIRDGYEGELRATIAARLESD